MIGQEFFYEVSDQEIEAIIAHEIGHIKYNHVNKSILVLIQATMLARNLIGKFKRNSMIIHPLEYKARQFALCSATRMIHSLIIGKSFERQADEFAYKVMGRGKGFIRFFERMEEEDRKKEADFVETYGIIENSKDNLRLIDRALLKTRYYFALVEDKAFTWIYHNTRLGAHPSHEERIKAAKKYLAEHPEAA